MPRGSLIITAANGRAYNAYNEWGLSLSDGAISTLLAPPAIKERVSNTSRLEDGKRVDDNSPVRYDARELTLEMHFTAPDFETLVSRYQSFFDTIAKSPSGIYIQFSIYGRIIMFGLRYKSCQQFGVYGGTLAKFAVRFEEATPALGDYMP